MSKSFSSCLLTRSPSAIRGPLSAIVGTKFALRELMPTERIVILAAIDASSNGALVAAAAARIAAAPSAQLHLVHVIEVPDTKHLSAQLETGKQILESAMSGITNIAPVFHLSAGAPVVEILQVAANIDADLLVLGTQELSSFERLFLGSVVEPVARRAQCQVLIVRRKDYHRKKVKEIEPPCADCLATQRKSNGDELWCARHRERHVHGRLHYELPESFGVGSTFIRPGA